jgi:hypothetical protein
VDLPGVHEVGRPSRDPWKSFDVVAARKQNKEGAFQDGQAALF